MRNKVWAEWLEVRRRNAVMNYKVSESYGVIHNCKKRKALQRWFLRVKKTQKLREKA